MSLLQEIAAATLPSQSLIFHSRNHSGASSSTGSCWSVRRSLSSPEFQPGACPFSSVRARCIMAELLSTPSWSSSIDRAGRLLAPMSLRRVIAAATLPSQSLIVHGRNHSGASSSRGLSWSARRSLSVSVFQSGACEYSSTSPCFPREIHFLRSPGPPLPSARTASRFYVSLRPGAASKSALRCPTIGQGESGPLRGAKQVRLFIHFSFL